MNRDLVWLWLAAFFFAVALVFWFGCVFSGDRQVRLMSFWYAVIFDNVGYLLLVGDRVTNS